MPMANRASLRLTPAGVTQPARDYLKAQPPACWATEASLAVFALLTVACLFCIHLFYTKARWAYRFNQTFPHLARNPGNVDRNAAEQGSGPVVDEKRRRNHDADGESTMGALASERALLAESRTARKSPQLSIDPQWTRPSGGSHFTFMTRSPPGPPLTPPELSSSVFSLEHRAQLQENFMHQPNPDYLSSTDSPATQPSSVSPSSARRRSYNKSIPVGVPAPHPSSAASEPGSADTTFLSSSYPPTSSLLPPPPPGLQQFGHEAAAHREIEVQGEIISALDSDGAGWTRHTRVFGGGVCLACAATGGNHGGGFYGENVSPEEMH